MITTELKKKIAPQVCPLCGNEQDVIINGWDKSENGVVLRKDVQEDKGYSFCNCHNIFFTDWSNIKQDTYNPEYFEKYQHSHIDKAYRMTAERQYQKIKDDLPYNSPFPPIVLDVGSINPSILDFFKEKSFKTIGLDIHDHHLGQHEMWVGNFEDYNFKDFQCDLLWASHIVEHFHFPIEAVKKFNSLLNDGGLLYIAMPDPYFIDFDDPYKWAHWHLKEHHILWDMDSFCDLLCENGFEIIHKERNTHVDQICILDYCVIAKKKIELFEGPFDKYGRAPHCLEK